MSQVAVVGAGTMGNGIAHVFAQSGWATTLIDVSSDALERALATIGTNLDRQVKKGAVTLEGRVHDEKAREKAARIAKKVKGVTSVDNKLKLLSET